MKSEENISWLGQKAILQVYQYEGNSLVLTANLNGTDYQMVMSATSNEMREQNKPLFLEIANTLKIK